MTGSVFHFESRGDWDGSKRDRRFIHSDRLLGRFAVPSEPVDSIMRVAWVLLASSGFRLVGASGLRRLPEVQIFDPPEDRGGDVGQMGCDPLEVPRLHGA